ncbi:MAG: hypothetical protein QG600_187 [Patescibacteria group bacterium]|nr:hypothetical protein [Patescibacteria group bacterium]
MSSQMHSTHQSSTSPFSSSALDTLPEEAWEAIAPPKASLEEVFALIPGGFTNPENNELWADIIGQKEEDNIPVDTTRPRQIRKKKATAFDANDPFVILALAGKAQITARCTTCRQKAIAKIGTAHLHSIEERQQASENFRATRKERRKKRAIRKADSGFKCRETSGSLAELQDSLRGENPYVSHLMVAVGRDDTEVLPLQPNTEPTLATIFIEINPIFGYLLDIDASSDEEDSVAFTPTLCYERQEGCTCGVHVYDIDELRQAEIRERLEVRVKPEDLIG